MDSSNRKRQARWILTAAAGTVVLAVVIILATSGGTGRPPATAVPPAVAGPCPVSRASDTIPTGLPPDLQWKSIGVMPVPTSATFGPARYRSDLWTCFAHSPMGAVMAVYDIPGSLVSPDWLAAAQQELGPGPGQDAFIRISEEQTYQPLTPGEIAQPIGFQVAYYTPQIAVIQLLADAGNGEYQEDTRSVAWIDGDWKLSMTPDGKSGPDPQLVTSAGGFVLWGGSRG